MLLMPGVERSDIQCDGPSARLRGFSRRLKPDLHAFLDADNLQQEPGFQDMAHCARLALGGI
jgi:hypothetical protein